MPHAVITVPPVLAGVDVPTGSVALADLAFDPATQTELDTSATAKVDKATFDANSILKADTDNTPVALTVAASQVIGRKASGSIVAMTMAELRALLGSGTPDATTILRGDGAWSIQGAPAGLTGATQATRYVGGTVSGAPTTGTFAIGDFVVTQAGNVWICTVAGSPGTWVRAGMRVIDESHATTPVVNTTAQTDLVSLTLPGGLVAVGDVVRFRAMGDILNNSAGAINYTMRLKFGSTTVFTTSATSLSISANRRKFFVDAEIIIESTTAQRLASILRTSNAGGDTWGTDTTSLSATGSGFAAEDTATAKAVALTVNMSVADLLADARCIGASLTHLRKAA